MNYLFLVLAGITTGIFSSLFGLGGGLIVVPALVIGLPMLGIPNTILMHMAIGTSLAIMFINSINTVRSHQKFGNIIWPVVWKILPYIILGTIVGAIVAFFMSTLTLMIVYISYLSFIIINFLRKMNHQNNSGVAEGTLMLPSKSKTALTGVLTGVFAACIGGGSSVVMVPFLKHCGFLIKKASAMAGTFNVFIALVATISFNLLQSQENNSDQLVSSFICWPAFIWIVLASFIGVPIGTYCANKFSDKMLSWIYFSLLITVFMIMIVKSIDLVQLSLS